MVYYATFRHRRPLTEPERSLLLNTLLRSDGKYLDVLIACVLPEATEIVFTARVAPSGETYELSDILEKAKTKAGRKIIKSTSERFPPFYNESYDRIIRDEIELEERWSAIFDSPIAHELVEDVEEYSYLWVADAPTSV